MKKLLCIIVTICVVLGIGLGIRWCILSNTIVSTDIKYIRNTNELSNSVMTWLKTKEDTKGVFLGKKNGEGNLGEYYLYINKLKNPAVGIRSDKYDGISISFSMSDTLSADSQIFRIKEVNKKMKYIILNDKKINVNSIEEIP